MRCQVSGDACCAVGRRERGTERHAGVGVDLPQFSRLGELGQGPVDLDQKLRILGPHRQGHVPALARHVLGHEPQLEPGMLVQVPGGEVGVQERGVQPRGLEPIEQLFARLEAGDRVVLLREGHRAGHDPDPFAAEVGQGTDASRVARDHQPELGAGIGNAPGHVARRPGLMRLADDHVTTAVGQAMPGALGTGTPVEFDRPPQDAAHLLRHGHIEALRRSVRRFAGPRHRGRHGADGQNLGRRAAPSSSSPPRAALRVQGTETISTSSRKPRTRPNRTADVMRDLSGLRLPETHDARAHDSR